MNDLRRGLSEALKDRISTVQPEMIEDLWGRLEVVALLEHLESSVLDERRPGERLIALEKGEILVTLYGERIDELALDRLRGGSSWLGPSKSPLRSRRVGSLVAASLISALPDLGSKRRWRRWSFGSCGMENWSKGFDRG